MSTVVLLHGAWHGGWAWQRVVPGLRAAGHDVHTPTLTGLSDRAHLLTPQVGLSTHVQDVVALLEAHDARDVVLVGHSYAGQVVTGVADRVPDRVARRVYLDAFVGDDGDAAIDLLPRPSPGTTGSRWPGPGSAGWSRSARWSGSASPSRPTWTGSPRGSPRTRGSPTPSRCG
nr:alpha/beta fold hydrolase [Pseudonocardia sp. AL041005-10]